MKDLAVLFVVIFYIMICYGIASVFPISLLDDYRKNFKIGIACILVSFASLAIAIYLNM